MREQGTVATAALTLLAAMGAAIPGAAYAQEESTTGAEAMTYVTGFGGFFFRAEDPEKLEAWYHENLGINLPPKSYTDEVWHQAAGPTIFHPFPKDTAYFGDPSKQFMLNFRVTDLDALVAHLRKNGNAVEVGPEVYPNGRFAKTTDPEGTPIQLWEPGGDGVE